MYNADMDPTTQELTARLRAHGLRSTRPGRALLAVLSRLREPVAAKEIHKAMRSCRCDLATVHRLLARFAQAGLLRAASLHGKSRWYELAVEGSHHHHLVCLACRRIEPLPFCEIAKFQRVVRREKGFRVLSHSLELFGLCRACARQAKDGGQDGDSTGHGRPL